MRRVLAILAMIALASCDDEPVFFVSLWFVPAEGAHTAVMFVRDTATLRALASARGWPTTVRHDSENGAARRFRWTSSDTTVAHVSPDGLVEARATGVAMLRAEVDGVISDPLALRVSPQVSTLWITPSMAAIRVGDTVAFQIVARDAAGEPLHGILVSVRTTGALGPSIETPFLATPGTLHFRAGAVGRAEVFAAAYHGRFPRAIHSDTSVLIVTAP